MIEVNEPFEMNEFVRPACLPARQVLPSETCIVSGWGRILNEEKVDKGSTKESKLGEETFIAVKYG